MAMYIGTRRIAPMYIRRLPVVNGWRCRESVWPVRIVPAGGYRARCRVTVRPPWCWVTKPIRASAARTASTCGADAAALTEAGNQRGPCGLALGGCQRNHNGGGLRDVVGREQRLRTGRRGGLRLPRAAAGRAEFGFFGGRAEAGDLVAGAQPAQVSVGLLRGAFVVEGDPAGEDFVVIDGHGRPYVDHGSDHGVIAALRVGCGVPLARTGAGRRGMVEGESAVVGQQERRFNGSSIRYVSCCSLQRCR